jgi:hypothetical protein
MSSISGKEKYPSRLLALAGSAFVCVGIFIFLYWIWYKSIRSYYFPYGDEFSLIVNSTSPFHPNWTAWFLSGFKNYFDVYTESFVPYTNFIRPTVNLTFFLDYLTFGSNWSMYILTTYGFVSAIAGVTSFVAYYVLRLGWRLSLLAAICTAIAPSFLSIGPFFYPSSGFDLLAGMIVLLGVYALIADALLPAWIFFTIAAFTKETALFAPCFAAIIVFIIRNEKPRTQRYFTSASFLLPVFAWMALYWHDFKSIGGIYVLKSSVSITAIQKIILIIKKPLHWPIAVVDRIAYWHSPHILLKLVFILGLSCNVVTWMLLLWGLALLVRMGKVRTISLGLHIISCLRTLPITIVAAFCIGSILMPVVFALPGRFGGVFYPLFILLLIYVAHNSSNLLLRAYSILVIIAIGIVGCSLMYANIVYYLPSIQGVSAMSKDYVDELKNSKSPRIFVFDDVSGGYAAISSVKRFSEYDGQLVRLNDLMWNFTCQDTIKITVVKNLTGDLILDSTVPKSCGEHDFNGLQQYDFTAPQVVFDRKIVGGELKYWLVRYSNPRNPAFDSDHLRIVMHLDRPGGVILIPNFSARSYNEVKLQ